MSPHPRDIYLSPGEHFVGDAGHRVHTLLGSCVSITLWHPQQRVGAISHFLLAERQSPRAGVARGLDARYGSEAFTLMLQALRRLGVDARQCQAKIFGGANMFPGQPHTLQVGRRNGDAARELLAAEGIDVVSDCLFGEQHMRIIFDIASGDVWARRRDDEPVPPGVKTLSKAGA